MARAEYPIGHALGRRINGVGRIGAGMAFLLLLAACGGRPDDGLTRVDPANDPSSGQTAPASSISSGTAAIPASMQIASGAASNDELGQMKQQIALLRREVADIRQQLSGLPGAVHSTELAPNPRTDSSARLEAARTEQMRMASSESTFRNERQDARWSQTATADVRSALAEVDDAVRSQVRAIECRSQSCRVEINADPSGTLARDLPVVIAHLAQALPNVTAGQIDQGDGHQATVLYLSR